MAIGRVKWFNSSKGYGFIISPDIEGEVFAHFSTIVMDGYRKLEEGEQVSFDLIQSSKGLTSTNVQRIASRHIDAAGTDWPAAA